LAQAHTTGDGTADRLTVTFESNNLARELFGEFDENLALIEDRLDIETHAHGNLVALKGAAEAIKTAKAVLLGLYDRLRDGQPITPGDVDGAIRHLDPLAHQRPRNPLRRKKPDVNGAPLVGHGGDGAATIRTKKRLITGRSKIQSLYLETIERCELTFSIGPAGTGKTYLAVAFAAAALERGLIERLILSRPAVEAGERLGFLPGDMRDKIDPYLRPLYDALYDMLPPEKVEHGLESGAIEIAPLAFMRGRTLSHAFVILDEAQNCTPTQMKMFLTRLGEGSRMVVTGDPSQIDLPKGQRSGLVDATGLLRNVEGVGHIGFTGQDVVRHDLVTRIVNAYDDADRRRRRAAQKRQTERDAEDQNAKDRASGSFEEI